MIYRLIAISVLFCFFCCAAFADTIELNNGRKLHGKIVEEDEKTVTLQLPNKGLITVSRDKIKSIEKNEIEGPKVPPPSTSPLVPPNPEEKKKPEETTKEDKTKEDKKEEKPSAKTEEEEEKIDPELKKRIDELVFQLGHRDSGWRSNARAELKRIGKPAVKPLIFAIRTGRNSWQRWGAAEVLGDIGDPRAREVLVEQLRDPDKWVRKYAVEALRKITGQNFNYDPNATPETRNEAAGKWEEWWEKTEEEEKKKEEEKAKQEETKQPRQGEPEQ